MRGATSPNLSLLRPNKRPEGRKGREGRKDRRGGQERDRRGEREERDSTHKGGRKGRAVLYLMTMTSC